MAFAAYSGPKSPNQNGAKRASSAALGSTIEKILPSAFRQLDARDDASNAPSTVTDIPMLMPTMSTMPAMTHAM